MAPRAFSVAEADLIRDRLKSAAREAFGRRGLKATSVEELARAAGISKGAFYRFYDGKESLLLELADETEVALQTEIEAAVRADPGRGLEILVSGAIHAVDRNPLIRVLMSPEGLHALASRPVEDQEMFLDRDVRLVERVTALLQDGRGEPLVSDRVLLGLLRALVFVGHHRAEIGDELVDEVARWVAGQLRAAVLPDVPAGGSR